MNYILIIAYLPPVKLLSQLLDVQVIVNLKAMKGSVRVYRDKLRAIRRILNPAINIAISPTRRLDIVSIFLLELAKFLLVSQLMSKHQLGVPYLSALLQSLVTKKTDLRISLVY